MRRYVWLFVAVVGCAAESEPAQSSLRVLIRDAPADVDEVWVEFAGVSAAHAEQGWLTVSTETHAVDLLTLQDGVFEELGLAVLPPGHYEQVRLDVRRAWVVDDGVAHALEVPSGSESGIKIGHGFDVLECGTTTLRLDWDVGAHLAHDAQGYKLRPVIAVDGTTIEGCGPTLVSISQEQYSAASNVTVWDYYGDVRALWWHYLTYQPFDPALGTLDHVTIEQTLDVDFDLGAGTPGDAFSFRMTYSGGGYWAANGFVIDTASAHKTYAWTSEPQPDWTSMGWGYYFETATNTTPYSFTNVARLTYHYVEP